jgi:hypothetical protein
VKRHHCLRSAIDSSNQSNSQVSFLWSTFFVDLCFFESAQLRVEISKRVANLWTEFTAQHREAVATNGKEPQNPNKLVVAATFEKAKT